MRIDAKTGAACNDSTLTDGTTLATAASFLMPLFVGATDFGGCLFNFRIRLAADKDCRAREIQPKQKLNHRIQASIDSVRTEVILIEPEQKRRGDL